jgi:hypothetical protein
VRKPINLVIKKEIFSKRESGKSVGDLSVKFGMAKSTNRTILKNNEEIKSAHVAKGISRLSSWMVIFLWAVGQKWSTPKYTYLNVCCNKQML